MNAAINPPSRSQSSLRALGGNRGARASEKPAAFASSLAHPSSIVRNSCNRVPKKRFPDKKHITVFVSTIYPLKPPVLPIT